MTLNLRHLTLAYGDFRVLDDLSVEVPTNSIVGLIGPNGAGKSTLFSVVSGFIKQARGEIRFNGQLLDPLAAHERARLGLCRTFQVPREFRCLTVTENMLAAPNEQAGESLWTLFARPGKVRAEEAELKERAMKWLRFLKLEAVADQPAGSLSGGQKKLLELGRILMLEPRCVLLDEPYAGVNPVLIEQISDRIHELHSQGIGFVIVEHNLHMLAKLASSMVVLDRGRLLAQGTPSEALADESVRAAYMGA
ncbi:ATP-binding cassette domain-containing protein [Collimonas pratensis]|uniref:ABC transporter ATP-binding protein n=1 Tax=Collimonas pratensis TaxID=279113 RepID=UPI00143DFC94|nr:ABC transporter ATP-binding protein [Collimonas pratensis]NKI72734.1 ATP-binding cassette domain-containing protein [Collimonas pratensis]